MVNCNSQDKRIYPRRFLLGMALFMILFVILGAEIFLSL